METTWLSRIYALGNSDDLLNLTSSTGKCGIKADVSHIGLQTDIQTDRHAETYILAQKNNGTRLLDCLYIERRHPYCILY